MYKTFIIKAKKATNPLKSCSACGLVHKITFSCNKKCIKETARTLEERRTTNRHK